MYVVIGAGGFLGSYLIKNLTEKTDEEILAASRDVKNAVEGRIRWVHCDVLNDTSLHSLTQRINRERKRKIIWLPAFFNTCKAYDRYVAWNTNITAYAKFIGMLEGFEVFYSISTDMVFSKDSDIPYREDAAVSPLNDYARHKLAEEAMAAAAGIHIVRLPVMMGRSLSPYKKHFFDEIIENNRRGLGMKFFMDSWRSIIDFNTAAEALLELMESREASAYRIVNIAGDEALSKYDAALRIAKKYDLDTSRILPVSMKDDTEIWKERRPGKILLDNTLVKKLLHRAELKFSLCE
ncbi:sugar nucleotide-binding protein [uncultured Mailhella sp.]|uniref:sugar nucleotide-binding protein n=1 Tax=uncultured Mailhella sp. TaxID=1981031 RepID=UPI002627EE5B|nr:sugar nucleotide-binding protein [uncultured Mailhella sp.]